jgi:hypothetical protein
MQWATEDVGCTRLLAEPSRTLDHAKRPPEEAALRKLETGCSVEKKPTPSVQLIIAPNVRCQGLSCESLAGIPSGACRTLEKRTK